jgi:hypothetical protein
MKEDKLTVTMTVKFTEDDIEDIVVTALEGGIGYWACLDNNTPIWDEYRAKYPDEPCSILATQILLDGHGLEFTDEEDGARFRVFHLCDLMNGIAQYAEGWGNIVSHLTEEFDAESADMVWQFGLFSELVYG